MTRRRQALGRDGERAAARWYRRRGYSVVAQNWRHGRGELDLIACRGQVLVFCEVKTRTDTRFGSGFEAVTADKQRRVRALAAAYLDTNGGWRGTLRFDVVSVVGGHIEVLTDAF